MQIVFLDNKLYQLIAHDKSNNYACNRHNHIFRKAADHIEYSGVPCCRSCAKFARHFAYFGIDTVEQAGEVREYSVCQNPSKPIFNHLPYQRLIPPFSRAPHGAGRVENDVA